MSFYVIFTELNKLKLLQKVNTNQIAQVFKNRWNGNILSKEVDTRSSSQITQVMRNEEWVRSLWKSKMRNPCWIALTLWVLLQFFFQFLQEACHFTFLPCRSWLLYWLLLPGSKFIRDISWTECTEIESDAKSWFGCTFWISIRLTWTNFCELMIFVWIKLFLYQISWYLLVNFCTV